MPTYNIDVILRSDTTAATDTIFRNGTWDLTGGYSTITYSDEDTLGLGDNDPVTETGAAPVVTAVNGDTSHPLVGEPFYAKYVRSDDNDGDTDNDADVVMLGGTGFSNYALAAYPGSGWSMNTGDTFISGGTTTTHFGGGSWSQEGFLPGTTVPCFTTGMEIETDQGPIKVEDIEPGMRVRTYDNGLQVVKFISRRTVPAMGSHTPVRFAPGSIGNDRELIVSQKHRMYVASLPAEMRARFGRHTDTLIQAVELCNGTTIRLSAKEPVVTYFHMMFGDHQLVYCHGTVSESWQPTKAALKKNPEQAAELLAIFPELASRRANHPGAQIRHEITTNRTRKARAKSSMQA